MPFIRITVFGPTLSVQHIERLQQGTTDLMGSVMRKPLQGTSVLVEQVGQGGWRIAGEPVGAAAHVDVVIGKDTNRTADIAQFMSRMMKLLRSVVGRELRDETYIVVHEMDATTYGRGGLSRAERDRERERAT